MLYRALRPLLFALPPELAHHLGFGFLRAAAALPGAEPLLRRMSAPKDPALRVEALGTRFPTPVGLAAGFDKNAEGFEALGALGFGHVEVGTLTGQAQPGNPKPRMFRLPKDQALINRLGFNNRGSADAVQRLARPRRTRVGINIGKSKVVPEAEAAADYVASARRIAPYADYVVVNVSSPNTPGLRNLQAVESLEPLLRAVRVALEETVDRRVPLLVKIAPDLNDADVDAVADLALELSLEGIVATNTTVGRTGLHTSADRVEAIGAGGLSGPPVRDRAVEVLRQLRSRVGERLTLVSVGGLSEAEDGWRRIRAGATLLQLYTGFVYGGPLLPRRLAIGIGELARRDGFERVQEAVGVDARDAAPAPQNQPLRLK